MEPTTPVFCLRACGKEAFACATTAFVRQHLPHLVPAWSLDEVWAIVLLQQATVPLEDITPTTAAEKQRLRREFISFGFALAFTLQTQGFATEVFDPRSAFPLLSPPGELRHNDVRAAANLPAMQIQPGVCPLLVHPIWGTAVYPATILTAAPPPACEPVLQAIAQSHGWPDLQLERTEATL
ncbi:MAG: methylmalonic aciduria and homocystinuria type D protein [Cyanobacteria bacterium J06641_5]